MRRLSSFTLRRWAMLPLCLICGALAFRLGLNIAAAATSQSSFLWGLATGGVIGGGMLAGRAILNPALDLETKGVRLGLAIGTAAALAAGIVYLVRFPLDYPAAPVVWGLALTALIGGWLFLPLLFRPNLTVRLGTGPVRALATAITVVAAMAVILHTAYMLTLPLDIAGRVLVSLLLASLLGALWLVPAFAWGVWRRKSPVDSAGQSG